MAGDDIVDRKTFIENDREIYSNPSNTHLCINDIIVFDEKDECGANHDRGIYCRATIKHRKATKVSHLKFCDRSSDA